MSNGIPIFAMSPTEAVKIVLMQAAELQALRATNADLLESLKECYALLECDEWSTPLSVLVKAKAAIERAGNE